MKKLLLSLLLLFTAINSTSQVIPKLPKDNLWNISRPPDGDTVVLSYRDNLSKMSLKCFPKWKKGGVISHFQFYGHFWPFVSVRPVSTVWKYSFDDLEKKDWDEVDMGHLDYTRLSIRGLDAILQDERFPKASTLWIVMDNLPRKIPVRNFHNLYRLFLKECGQSGSPNPISIPGFILKSPQSSKRDRPKPWSPNPHTKKDIMLFSKGCTTGTLRIFKEQYHMKPYVKAMKERCSSFSHEYIDQYWRSKRLRLSKKVLELEGCARSVRHIYFQLLGPADAELPKLRKKYCSGL